MKACVKLLSMLLVLAMCIGFVSVTAFADEPVVIIVGEEQAPAEPAPQEPAPQEPAPQENAGQPAQENKGFTPAADTVAVINIKSAEPVEKTSLQEAIDAAKEGATITLVKDTTVSGGLNLVKDVKLDLKGFTLRLKDGKDAKAAIVAAPDAQITITNGTLDIGDTFAAGFLAKDGANLSLGGLYVDYDGEGSLFLEGEGNINVMSGKYAQNPEGFLAKGYGSAEGKGGMFVVSKGSAPVTEDEPTEGEEPKEGEDPAGEPTDGEEPKEGEELKEGEEPKEGESDVPEKTPDAEIKAPDKPFAIGENGYDTLQDAVDAVTAENSTITVQKDVDDAALSFVTGSNPVTIDLGGHTLTFPAAVDLAAADVTLKNGTVKGNVDLGAGVLTLDKAKIDGNLSVSADIGDAGLKVADAESGVTGTMSVDLTKNTVDMDVSAGTFGGLTVTDGSMLGKGATGGEYKFTSATKDATRKAVNAIAKIGLKAKENSDYYTLEVAVVKITDGGSTVYFDSTDLTAGKALYYTKNGSNSDIVLVLDNSNTWTGAVINALDQDDNLVKTLSAGDYAISGQKLTIPKDASFLNSMPAGVCYFDIWLEDGGVAYVDLWVYPALTADRTRYVKNSGKDIVVTLTDLDEGVMMGSGIENGALKDVVTLGEGTDFTRASGNVVNLKSSYLDTLCSADSEVTKVFAFLFDYEGQTRAVTLTLTLAPPPSIEPDTTTWKRGASKDFIVKPDVNSVTLDGTAVSASNFSVKDKTLTLKAAAVADLKYGDHTLVVNTKDGDVTAKITLLPSLGYTAASGNQHTKGGSKNLVYVASDPVSSVQVGGTTLTKGTHYTLSEDGKTITFPASFLNTLAAADYTVTATVTADGKTYDTTAPMRILSTGAAGANPKTGDESSVALWATVLALSGAAVVVLIPKKKRQ